MDGVEQLLVSGEEEEEEEEAWRTTVNSQLSSAWRRKFSLLFSGCWSTCRRSQ